MFNQGRGRGGGQGPGGGAPGRGGCRNKGGFQPGGLCLCPACGEKVAHRQGVPCPTVQCPKCGAAMIRE